MAGDVEAGVPEHIHHRPIVGQRLRLETLDAVASRHGSQVFQHHGGQTSALVMVFDDEGDLGGLVVLESVVAGHCDDEPVQLGDECESVSVVDLDQTMQLCFGQLRKRREESEVDRLR